MPELRYSTKTLLKMTTVSEAVILMAGEGSRLRGSDSTFLKPFVPVLGRPLISYALDTLIRAGITSVNFVVGYESGRMIEQVKQLIPSGLSASFIENRHWPTGRNKMASRFLRPLATSANPFFSR